MKLVLLLIVVVLALTGCTEDKVDTSIPGYSWSIIESPITGNCYEVAGRSPILYKGYMGMARVECPE